MFILLDALQNSLLLKLHFAISDELPYITMTKTGHLLVTPLGSVLMGNTIWKFFSDVKGKKNINSISSYRDSINKDCYPSMNSNRRDIVQ